MNMFIPKKTICSVILQYILLPTLASIPLIANSSPSGEQERGNGKGQQRHGNNKENKYYDKQLGSHVSFNVNFGHVRSLAIEYGLTGYRGLPPGIAKQVNRGKPLPAGVAIKGLPSMFLAQLPVYAGYEWKMSGRDLIQEAVGTAVVVEIIENVFE